jgi:hypothetical protein
VAFGNCDKRRIFGRATILCHPGAAEFTTPHLPMWALRLHMQAWSPVIATLVAITEQGRADAGGCGRMRAAIFTARQDG